MCCIVVQCVAMGVAACGNVGCSVCCSVCCNVLQCVLQSHDFFMSVIKKTHTSALSRIYFRRKGSLPLCILLQTVRLCVWNKNAANTHPQN